VHGVGRASGAVTIVNALPTGVGSALGVGLYADAEATIGSPPDRSDIEWLTLDSGDPTPLVTTSVRLALERFAPGERHSIALRLRSEIPPARGLKSSSAVASAISLAVADAMGARPSVEEVATLSARASLNAGVSATGAYDDALAGLSEGFVVTDNLRQRVLRQEPADPDWLALLLVPGATHSASPQWRESFRAAAPASRRAVDAVLRADWWRAMELNSDLVERTMGYSFRAARDRLVAAGALGAGVSGLGPALAAIGPGEAMRRIEALPSSDGAKRLLVPVRARARSHVGRVA
jgi:shikimate kinase